MGTTKIYIMDEPQRGRFFEFEASEIYIGRSKDNDLPLDDRFVSLRHLKVTRRGDRYFVKDLSSENGTFVNCVPISPDIEFEVKEGTSIAIGLSMVCLGKACPEDVRAFHALIKLNSEVREKIKSSVSDRRMAPIKSQELVQRVSSVLLQSPDAKEVSEKTAKFVFRFLKRIDRVAVILIDPESGKFLLQASRSRKPARHQERTYCWVVVDKVIREKEAIVVKDSFGMAKNEFRDTLRLLDIGSVMCVPMVSGAQVRGVIYVDSLNRPDGFRQEDRLFLNNLSRQAAHALEYAFHHERLEA